MKTYVLEVNSFVGNKPIKYINVKAVNCFEAKAKLRARLKGEIKISIAGVMIKGEFKRLLSSK